MLHKFQPQFEKLRQLLEKVRMVFQAHVIALRAKISVELLTNHIDRISNHPRLKRLITWLDFEGPESEAEFLPAALEVINTPPLPLGRAIGGSIMLFFLVVLFWACVGSVNIIATAQGKILPAGRIKIIQPLESGVVRAIHVQDGQAVKAGDVLIEIDSTINGAERDRLNKEYTEEQLHASRLKASLELDNDPMKTFRPPPEATESQVATEKNLLANQVQEIHAKLDGLDQQIMQQQGNRAAVQSTINKLNDSIPYLQKRAEAREYLAKKGYGSKLEYLTTAQDLVEHQQDLQVQQGRLQEASGAVASLQEQRRQAEAEYRHKNLDELTQTQQKVISLHDQLIQASEKYRLQTLTAPVDGTVQQLAIHTEGGVVTPAQALLVIVPLESHLEIQAMVSNRDIGFVHEGQDVAVKIDTFNYTRYGLLHGKVTSISQDSITRDKPVEKGSGNQSFDSGSDSSEPAGQELVYAARISLDKVKMQIDDRMVNLEPGMAVTVEIKTGTRHIISYLLSPLSRAVHEALSER